MTTISENAQARIDEINESSVMNAAIELQSAASELERAEKYLCSLSDKANRGYENARKSLSSAQQEVDDLRAICKACNARMEKKS